MTGDIQRVTDEQQSVRADAERLAAVGRVGLHIGVFCSANDLPPKYTEPVAAFTGMLAERGHNLVWGGSDLGLMKVVASTVQEGGGKIIGVTDQFLMRFARKSADEMIITENLAERKAVLLARSDVLALLVGGTGTFDEITEILEQNKRVKAPATPKPMVVLNTDGFYDGFQTQLQRMQDDGMLKRPYAEMIHFSETPEQAIEFIDHCQVPARVDAQQRHSA